MPTPFCFELEPASHLDAMHEITRILEGIEQNKASADDLLPLVYEELRILAASRMADEAAGHTLQPTALVHEV